MDTLTHCSRCGDERLPKSASESWRDYWPNYGRIEIGFAAQIGYALHLPTPFSEGHQTLYGGAAQVAIIEWGKGLGGYDSAPYQMCYECQKQLLGLLGDFFKYSEVKR